MVQDVRFAIRSAMRNPALTSVIVISLALGIGLLDEPLRPRKTGRSARRQ